jgi:hypothetical protein
MQKSSIWITSIHAPINGGTVWIGLAENTDGDRFNWGASPDSSGAYCFREHESGIWVREKASEALVNAVHIAIRAAIGVH